MKKTLAALLCILPLTAYAESGEYGEYDENDMELLANCPACDCHCDDTTKSHDTYAGFRLYKNEHSAFSYTRSHGNKIKETHDNFGFAATVGNRLADFIRIEYETMYMGAKHSKYNHDFEYDIWSNMFNTYLMYDIRGVVAPYAGAGIGLTGIWGQIDGKSDNSFDLAYQASVGVLFTLNPRVDLDLGFRYINFGRVEHSHGITRVDATQLHMGAAYKFSI